MKTARMPARFLLPLCVLGIMLRLNVVGADDYNPPEWRADPCTTYQRWEFDTNDEAPAPDAYTNPQGVPELTVAGDFPYTGWQSSYEGAGGVWRFEDYVRIVIPNFEQEHDLKRIWVQLTYLADDGAAPFILTQPDYARWNTVDGPTSSGNYYHLTYEILMAPNPVSETIYVQPTDCTLYLDEVVIDTICLQGPLCIVEFHHFARFAEHWLDTGCDTGNDWCGGADLDQLGEVDWLDLEMLLGEWLDYCPHLWPLE